MNIPSIFTAFTGFAKSLVNSTSRPIGQPMNKQPIANVAREALENMAKPTSLPLTLTKSLAPAAI